MNTAVIASTFRLHLTGTGLRLLTPRTPATTARTSCPLMGASTTAAYTAATPYETDKVLRHRELCMGLNVLYAKKNHDYGDSFHQTYIEEGMAMPRIRLGDKFSRFKTLSRILSSDSDQQAVTDESIRDTLLDLANYSIMTVLEIDDAQHEQEIAEQKTCDEGASNAD